MKLRLKRRKSREKKEHRCPAWVFFQESMPVQRRNKNSRVTIKKKRVINVVDFEEE